MSVELALALSRIGKPRILVVGDYIYDSEYYGEAVRFAQESLACPVWRENAKPVFRAGGAGAVWKMAEALGAQVEAVAMPIAGAASKIRFFINGVQSMRFDTDAHPLPAEQTDRIAAHVADEVQRADCVLIADYGKGVCTDTVLRAAIDGALSPSHRIPCIVDPAHGTEWGRYGGATAIKCNQTEWLHGHGGDAPLMLVTDGGNGIRMHGPKVRLMDLGDACRVPCRPRNVVDVTGAGDMVLAALGVCIAGGISWPDACKVANASAGLKCERRGAVPVPRCEVIADLLHGIKIIPIELLPAVSAGRKVVWANGAFDGMHMGHAHLLTEAKKQGDVLIVGVNTDESVRGLKGPNRPIRKFTERSAIVAGLACVDYVVGINNERILESTIKTVSPGVLVIGSDYRGKLITGSEYAGRVHFVERIPGFSTTEMIRRRLLPVID